MDQPPGSDISGTRSGSPGAESPSSQLLFSDQELSEHDASEEVLITPHGGDAASQEEKSLFPDHTTHTPRRSKRTRGSKLNVPAMNITCDSSDYDSPPKKLSLKEIFENHFHNKNKLKVKRYKKKVKRIRQLSKYLQQKKKRLGKGKKKRIYSLSLAQRKRRMFYKGTSFPFIASKYLPLKLYLFYEQSVLSGFLNYVKKIKSEKHLKKSLNDMGVHEDVEEELFETRKYRFMDDEEPISPISESGDDENETETHDAVIAENSSFILDCRIPSKKEWQISNKIKQSGKKRKKKSKSQRMKT